MADTPKSIGIIVPTKNRMADLEAAVKTLLAQTVLPIEIIIVDQSPGMESERAVRKLHGEAPAHVRERVELKYLHDTAIAGAATARNAGIEIATSDVLLFLDDDVELEKEFVENILAAYAEQPDAVGVSGVITNYRRAPLPMHLWHKIFFRGPFYDERQDIYVNAGRLGNSPPIRVSKFTGALMSFRARAVREHRFDATLKRGSEGEDVDLCLRMGRDAKLLMTPRARLVHKISTSARAREHWIGSVARGNSYLYYRHWNHGIRNRLFFQWMKFGMGLIAGYACLRRGSIDPWRDYRAAVEYGKRAAQGLSY